MSLGINQLGYIVEKMPPQVIAVMADFLSDKLGVNKQTPKQIEKWLQHLTDKQNIEVVFIPDNEWAYRLMGVDARSKPLDKLIELPEKFSKDLYSGNWYAIYLILHELGHVSLSHNRILHKDTNYQPSRDENPEFHADLFAVILLIKVMKMPIQPLFEFNLQDGVIDTACHLLNKENPYQLSLF